MKSLQCNTCRSSLVDGPFVHGTSAAGGIECEIRNIPTAICPKGCDGKHWYSPDFGVEVMEALSPDSPNIAKRKPGFLKTRHLCRNCATELGVGQKTEFEFRVTLARGSELRLLLRAPSMICTGCNAHFLQAQISSHDKFYIQVADLISEILRRDMIGCQEAAEKLISFATKARRV